MTWVSVRPRPTSLESSLREAGSSSDILVRDVDAISGVISGKSSSCGLEQELGTGAAPLKKL